MVDDSTPFTRRKILGSLGTIGAAGALGGGGTLAFFSDEEVFSNNRIEAGELDLKMDWLESYNGEVQESWPPNQSREAWGNTGFTREQLADVPQDLEEPVINLQDVKPGDYGEITISYHLFGNPGFVALCADNVSDEDNGITEPENAVAPNAPDSDGTETGDLGEAIQARLWYDVDCDNEFNSAAGDVEIASGSLSDVLDVIGDCYLLGPQIHESNETCQGSSNLVENGGFETPAVTNSNGWDIFDDGTSGLGWKVAWENGQPTYNGEPRPDPAHLELHESVNGWTHDEGTQHAELDSDWDGPVNGYSGEPASVLIYQDVDTPDGGVLSLSYAWSPRPNHDDNELEVLWNGSSLATHSASGGPGTSFTTESHFVSASPGNSQDRIAFKETGNSDALGMFLDDVQLRACTKCHQPSETRCVALEWELPKDVGNIVQTDQLRFDLGFKVVQCRHNEDEAGNPIEPIGNTDS